MDRVARNRQAINAPLDHVGAALSSPHGSIQTQYIRDHEGGHYLLFSNGWTDKKRVYGCLLHMDLAEDGKVWLQHDGTDLIVAQMLMNHGVAKSDLVLAFYHPEMRADTGLAVA